MNNSPVYKCRMCINTSLMMYQEMNECCYDDSNLLECDDLLDDSNLLHIDSIIKIQKWYKKLKNINN